MNLRLYVLTFAIAILSACAEMPPNSMADCETDQECFDLCMTGSGATAEMCEVSLVEFIAD